MSGKYHVSNDGKVRPCKAVTRTCHLVHGDTPESAIENDLAILSMEKITLTRKPPELSPSTMKARENLPLEEVNKRLSYLSEKSNLSESIYDGMEAAEKRRMIRAALKKTKFDSPLKNIAKKALLAFDTVRGLFKASYQESMLRLITSAATPGIALGAAAFAATGATDGNIPAAIVIGGIIGGASGAAVGILRSFSNKKLDSINQRLREQSNERDIRAAKRENKEVTETLYETI